MSTVQERFDSHAVHAALERALTWIGTTDESAQAQGHGDEHARIRRVCEFAQRRLASADPQLTPASAVDSLASSLDSISAELEAFSSNGNVGHLTNANTHGDSVAATAVAYLYVPSDPAALEEAQAAASSYRRSLGQLARNASEELEAVRTEIAATRDDITEQESKLKTLDARLDSVVQTAQTQFTETQRTGDTQIASAVSQGQQAIANVASAGEQQIVAIVNDGQARLEEILAEVEVKRDEALTDASRKADAQLQALEEEGENRITQLDEQLEKAIRTVAAIGSTGMSGGYQIVAGRHEEQADQMRWIALGALAIAVIVGALAVVAQMFDWVEFSWESALTKLFITVPLLALAGYALNESSKHREQARVNKHIELQLASIDSYIARMHDDAQVEVKRRLAFRFFGRVPSVHAEAQADDQPALDADQ